MKKKILMIIACIGFCTAVNAQDVPPTPGVNPSNDANYNNTVKGEGQGQAPIAPATLLLLGLGASAVGATVYRNQKQKED